ncbi:MAG: WbqC family protein [Gammaproteobacteria bacterium]
MKLAIMQPYFFPYLGYWQLLGAVDRFVVLDDVGYINRGWINRNRILINGRPVYLTIPIQQASQNKRICDLSLQPGVAWRDKLLRMIENTYRKAPYFSEVFPVADRIIRHDAENLSDYLLNQLHALADFMSIRPEWVNTSRSYPNQELSGQERILDICRREGAATYINPEGGQALYDRGLFREKGIDLRFVVMRPLPYRQRSADFTPYLSIVDALMELGRDGIQRHLESFELSEGR